MTKITLTDLTNLNNQPSSIAAVNANNTVIENAFDNTLSRDGTSPNQMGATLDMNSNRIINLPIPSNPNDAARFADVSTIPSSTYFLQAGTGAVNRAWNDKVKERISLLDFIPTTLHAEVASHPNPSTATDLSTYIQNALNYLIGIGGGVLQVPPGAYAHNATMNLNNAVSIIIEGQTGVDTSNNALAKGSVFTYRGGAGTLRGWDCRQSRGVVFTNLSMCYNSSVFDGHLIDFSTPGNAFVIGNACRVAYCSFYQIGSSSKTAQSYVNLYRAIEVHLEYNQFSGAKAGTVGAPYLIGVTFTATSPGVVTWPGHGFFTNELVSFTNTGGALPAAITADTIYYVKTVLDANTFTISATAGGAAINFAGVGTGTHTGTAISHIESIACTIVANQFTLMKDQSIVNPGINWQIISGNVFEPYTETSAVPTTFQARGIWSIGGNQMINLLIMGNTFADGYDTSGTVGMYVNLGALFNTNIVYNSFGSENITGLAKMQAVNIRGIAIGSSISHNFFTATENAIKFNTTTVACEAIHNVGLNVWGALGNPLNMVYGMFFGDINCNFSGNYADVISKSSAVTVASSLNTATSLVKVHNSSNQQWEYVNILGMTPKLAAAPTTPVAGFTYYDTVLNKTRTWDGAVWNAHW